MTEAVDVQPRDAAIEDYLFRGASELSEAVLGNLERGTLKATGAM